MDTKRTVFTGNFHQILPWRWHPFVHRIPTLRTQESHFSEVVDLESRGFPGDRIRKYGFAFEGKEVLIKS